MDETLNTPSRFPVFLLGLRAAVGRVPLWLLCWAVPFVLAGALAFPFVDWFGETLDHRYEPGSVLAGMSEAFRFDHGGDLDLLRSGAIRSAAPLLFLMMLFGAFSAGGWLQVFLERTSGHSMRRFFWGGVKYFWRFFRVLLLTLLGLSLMSWICLGWPWNTFIADLLFGATGGDLEALDSERTAVWLTWLQDGTYAALFVLLLAWGDYTRTRLALHDTRSVLWAGLCTFFLLLRHPLATLRPFLGLFLIELAVVWGLGRLSWGMNTDLSAATTWKTIVLLFVIGQVAILTQVLCRAGRYKAAVIVSRGLVQPLAQPDPWEDRVGGPGGPQYPIDGTDEYGVSY
jgi:hypothetical protein